MTYNVEVRTSKVKWFIFLLIALVVLECIGVGYIGIWREGFWQAVETKATSIFIWKLGEFVLVALGLCLIAGYSQFLVNKIALLMRTKLTNKSMHMPYKSIEGGAQRIQEDCFNYPWLGLTLFTGLLRSTINVGTFSIIIGYQLGVYYLLIPIGYTIVGTIIAHYFAKPLINLNYIHQCVEATFRAKLTELTNKKKKMGFYQECYDNYMNLAVTTKKLNYFQSFYNQITVVVPYIIIAPLYFGSKILFGTFMQVASAMNHVIESMSYIINSYDMINNWLSCRRRLKEMGVINVKRNN